MIKLLIIDDHPIVRKGLKQILSDTGDIIIKEEASNGREALEKLAKSSIDAVILDISLPDRNGLDLIKDLKIIKPKVPILILTMHSEEQFAIRVLKAGASGFLNKDSVSEQLISAIRKVICGGRYISPALAEKLADNLRGESFQTPHQTLSDREFEVMLLIARGKTIKEIADLLNLSPKTVATYHARIMEKMNMDKDAEIIIYAMKNNLIDV